MYLKSHGPMDQIEINIFEPEFGERFNETWFHVFLMMLSTPQLSIKQKNNRLMPEAVDAEY